MNEYEDRVNIIIDRSLCYCEGFDSGMCTINTGLAKNKRWHVNKTFDLILSIDLRFLRRFTSVHGCESWLVSDNPGLSYAIWYHQSILLSKSDFSFQLLYNKIYISLIPIKITTLRYPRDSSFGTVDNLPPGYSSWLR